MAERSLSMQEVLGSILRFSISFRNLLTFYQNNVKTFYIINCDFLILTFSDIVKEFLQYTRDR